MINDAVRLTVSWLEFDFSEALVKSADAIAQTFEIELLAVCLDSDEPLLPAECQAVAVFGPDGLRVQQMRTRPVAGALADHVEPDWCTRLVRSLAPIRDVSAAGDDSGGRSSRRSPSRTGQTS